MLRSRGISEQGTHRLDVVRMRRRHLRGVMAIERQAYARPWSPNLFVAEMAEPANRAYLVAKIDKEVVGYAGMICYGDEAHITNVAVDQMMQGHRIASRLLIEEISRAAEMEAHAVSLEVRVTNWRAQRLYARFGFRPVGVRRNYYAELHEDALIMWTDDIRSPAYRRRLDAVAAALPPGFQPVVRPEGSGPEGSGPGGSGPEESELEEDSRSQDDARPPKHAKDVRPA
jgi:ribosomal-protein-alanine N-acetyltransferase